MMIKTNSSHIKARLLFLLLIVKIKMNNEFEHVTTYQNVCEVFHIPYHDLQLQIKRALQNRLLLEMENK